MDWKRRQAIACCACCLSSAIVKPLRARQSTFQGCLISSVGFRQFKASANGLAAASDSLLERNRHFRTTGDRSLDSDLDRALGTIADMFSVSPAFGFYDPRQFQNSGGAESNLMNAFASPENTDIPGTVGTVGFGWDLFQSEFFKYDRSGMTIMTIAAHEFAHVMQTKCGVMSQLRTGSPLKCEVNADFMAGYYLGLKKRTNKALRFQPAADLFQRIGASGPLRTHGTSQERLDAAEAGFRVAYVDGKSVETAFRAGLEYVGL